ncbi:MAG: phosphatase [Sphaerochaetaceae bacterium]|nr:phosphatase [Sphaerochaetaceae bacterium]
MNIVADLHCHTIASTHAYNTLRDNINAAKKKGLIGLAITDHGIACPDGPHLSYFENLNSLPDWVEGIRLLKGVEANIIDFDGNLDMPDELMKNLDIVVASFHTTCISPRESIDHTRAYLGVAENPHVDIIGHSGTPEFSFDYQKVIPVFKRRNKIVEINAHTFVCRKRSIPNCEEILRICKRNDVRIVVNSDAHSEFEVGTWDLALEKIRHIDFPEELIINSTEDRFFAYLREIGRDSDEKAIR